MTVIAKSVTYGLESKIKLIQQDLNNALLVANDGNWNGTINIYSRIQVTQNKKITLPEIWTESGEYEQLFINDKMSGSIGFYVTDEDLSKDNNATIDIIFSVILDEIYTNDDTLRQNERAFIEAKRSLENCAYINQVTDTKRGIKDVFSDFTTDKIKHRDMQPWFVFSFSCDVTYANNLCTSNVILGNPS